MPRSKTTLKKGDNLPGRGRSQKTLILEAIREESLIDLHENSTREESEKAFIAHTAMRAFNPDDPSSAMLLKVLWDKGWSSAKPMMNCVDFEFDKDTPPHEQASQVLKAASIGRISPDVAAIFIQSIASMMKIEEVTELSKRLDEIEKALGIDG